MEVLIAAKANCEGQVCSPEIQQLVTAKLIDIDLADATVQKHQSLTANALCGAQGVRSQESEVRMIESATRTDLIFVFFIAGNNP